MTVSQLYHVVFLMSTIWNQESLWRRG